MSPAYKGYKEWGVLAGMAFAVGEPTGSHYRALEFGFARGGVAPHNLGSAAVYFTHELVLDPGTTNGSGVVWGPKLGCQLGFLIFHVGAETVYYTNFLSSSWRGAFTFGLGHYPLSLSVRPQFKIAGNDGLLRHDVQLAFTCRFGHWGRK